jgi:hypothetical protein
MPTTYYGNATNPSVGTSTGAFVAINTTTNSAPISVSTTPTLHSFSTGDCVEIVGAQDPYANGVHQITVTSTTAFTLNNTTGSLIGGAYGNVRTCTVDPSVTIPNAGEAVSAANVGVVAEHATDLGPFLYLRTGRYRLVDQYVTSNSSPAPWTQWAEVNPLLTTNQWTPLSPPLFSYMFAGYSNPPGVAAHDVLYIRLKTDISWLFDSPFFVVLGQSSSTNWQFASALGICINGNTTPSVWLPDSVATLAPYTHELLSTTYDEYMGHMYQCNVIMYGVWTPNNAYNSFDICPMVGGFEKGGDSMSNNAGAFGWNIYHLTVMHYRLNT